jgi:potassium-transporting ATPase KdpC subunit
MALLKMIKNAFLLTLVFTVFFGGLYPLMTFLIGRTFFPFQSGGSLLFHPQSQTMIGSKLIAQNFTSSIYFHSRPSMTKGGPYNASSSGGSELSISSPLLMTDILSRAEKYKQSNFLADGICIPIDAVTASASGLDPHISISNALIQAPRVAKARGLSEEEINLMVQNFTERPFFGLLGEARINVLLLNLALDHALIEKEK